MQLGFVMRRKARRTRSSGSSANGERRGGRHNVFLQATPITVSDILRNTLFEHLESAVLTSATLTVLGGFDYITDGSASSTRHELVVLICRFGYREPGAALYSA